MAIFSVDVKKVLEIRKEQAEKTRIEGQEKFIRNLVEKISGRAKARGDRCQQFLNKFLVALFWYLECGVLPPYSHLTEVSFLLKGILEEVQEFSRHQAEKDFLLITLARELVNELLMGKVRNYHRLAAENPNEFFGPELESLAAIQIQLSLRDRQDARI